MNAALEKLNRATAVEAESMLRDCCGCREWARQMANSRPYTSQSGLFVRAAEVWNRLTISDWLEAFAAHPKIGESKAAAPQQKQSAEWSSGEQAGMNSVNERLRQDLAKANREYFDKFGFIFIVCATGKSGEEMLQLCRTRISNDRETEIRLAAEEQQKITEIRLRKLLSL